MPSGPSLMDVARAAAELARKHGALEAAAAVTRNREVQLSWRDGRLERLSEATTRALTLEVYADGRYAMASSSDLRPDALSRFVDDAVRMARVLAPDPARALPDPRWYLGEERPELDVEDPDLREVTPARRLETVQAIEAAARAAPGAGALLSVTADHADTLTETARVHTNGFEGTRRATTFHASASASVQDPDGRRPEDVEYAVTTHRSALPDPAVIGRKAMERTVARIGARKGPTGVRTIVVDPRAAGRLVGAFIAALSAAALQQKRSFLEGKLGHPVASALLGLTDDPLARRGLGSRLFDAEGLAARRFPVVEEGVLRSYYVDQYYGRKLGMDPTTRSPSNLLFAPGVRSQEALLHEVQEGLLVTGFLGGNSNATTGDFSLGLRGFEIAGGRIGPPVGEMNLSGNHLDFWRKLAAVGDDPFPYSSVRVPTLVFEGVMVAGV